MEKYRVVIEAVAPNAVGSMQKKINQWITTGLLKKYELHTCGDVVVFNILLRKEA